MFFFTTSNAGQNTIYAYKPKTSQEYCKTQYSDIQRTASSVGHKYILCKLHIAQEVQTDMLQLTGNFVQHTEQVCVLPISGFIKLLQALALNLHISH